MYRIVCLLLGLCLAGCALAPQSGARFPDPLPLGRDLPRPGGETEPVFPTGPLHLGDAYAAAIRNSPDLRATAWEVRAREAEAIQAGLFPNPELEAEVEKFAGQKEWRGARSAEVTAVLRQRLPVGGRLGRAVTLARRRAEEAGWTYEMRRIRLLTDVTRAFVNVVAGQSRVQLARQTLDLTKQVEEVTRRRVAEGAAPSIEHTRASILVEQSRNDLARAERNLILQRNRLAFLWGQDEAGFDQAMGSLSSPDTPVPDLSSLLPLVEDNPELARWHAKRASLEAKLALAESEALPDITLFAGAKSTNGENRVGAVAGIGLPLPLFNRNQGRRRAIRHRLRKVERKTDGTRIHLRSQLRNAHEQLLTARETVRRIDDRMLTGAQEVFDTIRSAYEKQRVDYLQLLDARRTLIDVRRRRIEALATYQKAEALVEGLVGRPLSETLRNE